MSSLGLRNQTINIGYVFISSQIINWNVCHMRSIPMTSVNIDPVTKCHSNLTTSSLAMAERPRDAFFTSIRKIVKIAFLS